LLHKSSTGNYHISYASFQSISFWQYSRVYKKFFVNFQVKLLFSGKKIEQRVQKKSTQILSKKPSGKFSQKLSHLKNEKLFVIH